ncbi:MAG: hypothetical protein CSA66_06420 [Proteobacteria bacterium]|nr:MAG: hypothetical protein CSA66_06420 [Pseudomonadota bacterium]
MNTNELKKQLMPFHDGELDAAAAAELARAVADSPELQADLAELRLINAFAADAFTASPAVADVDLSGVYDGVMARIAAEEAAESAAIEGVRVQREAEEPGLMDRFMSWLGEVFRFERPVAALAAMAVLVGAVGGLWMASSGGGGEAVSAAGPTMANSDPRPRRPAEGEVTVKPEALDLIAETGDTKAIVFDEEDGSALVLWHVVDGEGVTMPANNSGAGL